MPTAMMEMLMVCGKARLRWHRWKDAGEWFTEALKEEPNNAEAAYCMAISLHKRGKEAEAVPYYQRALELGLEGDDKPKALTWLASSLAKAGRAAEALQALHQADEAGGYEPREEYESIQASVLRRCKKASPSPSRR